jgi:hypothetical protein
VGNYVVRVTKMIDVGHDSTKKNFFSQMKTGS